MPVRTSEDCEDLFARRLLESIAVDGFAVVYEDHWAYTVGAKGGEWVVFGLPAKVAQHLLTQVVAKCTSTAEIPDPGEVLPGLLEGGLPLRVHTVLESHYRTYLPYARWYHRGPEFKARQLVWPDPDSRFPEHPEHLLELRQLQPLLET